MCVSHLNIEEFIIFSQIHFLNKDWDTFKTFIDKGSLPDEYGGDLPVPFVAGNLLVDLLKHYNEEVERKINHIIMFIYKLITFFVLL